MLRASSVANIANPTDPRAGLKQRKHGLKETKAQQRLVRIARKREERLEGRADKLVKVTHSPPRQFDVGS